MRWSSGKKNVKGYNINYLHMIWSSGKKNVKGYNINYLHMRWSSGNKTLKVTTLITWTRDDLQVKKR